MSRYNMYHIMNGEQFTNSNLSIGAVLHNTRIILDNGGEITGIIDTKDDK